MRLLARTLGSAFILAPLIGVGCNGTDESSLNATQQPTRGKTASSPGDLAKKGDGQQVSVTPDTAVDPKTLTNVVKEEVRGGEATGGPTPLPYLWLMSDESLIKDEPLAVDEPLGLDKIAGKIPLSNPMTKAKVELGKQLYFDPRISKDNTVSCATCHNPAKGWTDNLPASIGIKGQVGSRNAPTVLNTVYGRTMFWDGRAPTLEGQAQGPVQNKIEMGDQTYKEIIERLRTIPGYVDQFKRVFGTDVTLDGMAKAISAFERTALSGNSAYDRYTRIEDPEVGLKALNESAKRGMVLFGLGLRDDDEAKAKIEKAVVLRKAMCTSCHAGSNFTDEEFHNLGVGWLEDKKTFADLGRFVIAPIGGKFNGDIGAFKTPTLRDITRTGPYMHDGSETTLEQVIEFYDKGGVKNPHLDRDMKPLKLTKQEKADVVEFLKALTGDPVKVVMPTLPPGKDGKSPDPVAALEPPLRSKPKAAGLSADPHGFMAGR
jgi:cytochrome c peroxidase